MSSLGSKKGMEDLPRLLMVFALILVLLLLGFYLAGRLGKSSTQMLACDGGAEACVATGAGTPCPAAYPIRSFKSCTTSGGANGTCCIVSPI